MTAENVQIIQNKGVESAIDGITSPTQSVWLMISKIHLACFLSHLEN